MYGHLVVISRSGADGKAFPMHSTKVVIGRNETCDIRMQRAHVSKEHCVIRIVNNEVVLKNLSENCTSVNNTHVLEAGQQRALKSGDVITIVGRSLRYEENTNGSVTPTAPLVRAAVPQTVTGAVTNVGRPPPRLPVVFASGGVLKQQRMLRRKLCRTPRNADTARKLQLWDAHYSGRRGSATTSSDLLGESPPPGLFQANDDDDPFADTKGSGGSPGHDPRVAAEVARIMGQISQMARRSPPPPPQPLAEIESPTQQRQTPAQFFSSLPRPLAHPSLSLTSAATGAVTLSSPLKRTLSSNSHSVSGIRPPTVLARPTLPPNGDESEEVPTEPEPESDTETPSLLPQTPENQRIKRPALLAQESSMARKSVRFGPALSPEVFDAGAPPATPLRRGTLMQMAGRVASILRRGASPTRLAPLLETSPLRSLLTPRPSRRQAMHRHLARLAKDVDDEEERKGGDPGSPPSDLGSLSVIDIESPTVLGVSPADRRQRRRRSVRLSGGRRATLDSPLRSAGFKSSPVRANRPSPPPVLSLSEQRRERRRTAPPVIGDLATSMAQMAEALGEDVPVIFGSTPMAAEPVAAEPMAAEESAPVVEPLGLAEAMRQELDEKEEIEDEEEAVAESSSLAVLLEQAERQARIQGSSPDASMAGSDSLAVSCKLAGLSVTSPPPTPAAPAFDAKQTRKSRRQTIGIPAREEEEEEEEEEGSVDEILARRRALRRIQERKRRRQTVADLNKRRSSWRGWAAPGVGGVSPPSSPIISQSASHVDSTKPHVPCEKSHSSFPLTALSSTASASASAIMYPPPAWNNMERDTPAKSRGIVGIVAGALGMTRKNSLNSGVELAEDPKHGATPSFAYPPRPVPIDADWETVEAPVDDERLPSTVSEKDEPELTQQVELYAVSRPGSETGGDYLCQLGSAPTETNPDESTVVPEPVQEPEKPHSVVSPPATRGRTGRQQSSESSVSPSKQTRKSVGRHHSAAAVTVTTTASRKRRADDSTTLAAQPAAKRPAPKPTTQVAAKRGRGRPPNKNTAGRSAVEPQTFVISPPATRSSKRAKPPNLNH